MIVLSYFTAIWNSNIEDTVLKRKDERMNATTEFINSMKIIKLNSWVRHFIEKVTFKRNRELKTIKKSLLVN